MKNKYLVGVKEKDYIRLYDGIYLIGGSLSMKEAKEFQKNLKNSKIYKLIEVKK